MCVPLTTMETRCTKNPSTISSEHSWYLTPPSSDESSRFKYKCRLRKISDSPVLRSNDTDSLEREKYNDILQKVDILKELYQKTMVGTVCVNILNRLSKKDLLRASHVSRTWHKLIRYEDMRSGRIVSRFVRKMKAEYLIEKENKCRLSPKSSPCSSVHLSTPLTDTSNISRQKLYTKAETPASTPRRVSSKDLYQQCPQCQSPAKTTKQCAFCSKCNDTFCTHCFYTNNRHSPTCHVVGGRGITCSPNKLSSTGRRYSIGSKENKARLKRI